MKANRTSAKPDWRLDGTTITVRIPMTFVRRGGRKVIVAPDGGDAWAPSPPRPDEALIRALARAHRWKQMLEDGTHASINALAEAEKINRAYICRLLNMTLLAPDIQEAILDGRQPKGMRLAELTRETPGEWGEQRLWVSRQ